MGKAKTRAKRFHVGDRVRIPFGGRKVEAFIVEDRGAVGWRGRQIFAVRVPMEPSEPLTFEVPEEEIESADAGAASQ